MCDIAKRIAQLEERLIELEELIKDRTEELGECINQLEFRGE